MSRVTVIQFTQEQTRSVIRISPETMRHWRKAISYLSAKRGKAARFSFADLLSLAVTNELVNSFGVHITTLRTGVDAVFRLLAGCEPTSLERAIVFVMVDDAVFYEGGTENVGRLPTKPALMIPLAPLIAGIQRQMLPIEPVSSQAVLPFLPEPVRSRA